MYILTGLIFFFLKQNKKSARGAGTVRPKPEISESTPHSKNLNIRCLQRVGFSESVKKPHNYSHNVNLEKSIVFIG